jgi:type II secretory pathway component PulF
MSQVMKNYFAKRAFTSQRSEIYSLIRENLAETGSRKVSTIKELFDAWAAREASRKNPIALIHRSIAIQLGDGKSFTESLAQFIPSEEALLLDAGEASGRLVEALEACQKQCKASAEINGLVAAAMAQPAMSLVSILMTGYFSGLMLWPEMLKVVEIKHWPSWAVPLVKFEIALANRWQVVGLFFVVAALYFYSIPRWTGRVRSLFDHVPPWTVYRDRQAAAFLGILGGLLSSGMELDAALRRIEKHASPWLQWHIHRIRARLAVAGSNPLSSLNTGLFSEQIRDLIEDAARNRSFDATLTHLGTDALPIIVSRVKKMAAVTGSSLLIITGLIFVYQVAVQQSGVNQATSNFMRTQMK